MNGCRWGFNIIHFDEDMNAKQRIFAHFMIKCLREVLDPRRYQSNQGYVQPLKDFTKTGGENLVGYYKFKPTRTVRDSGLNIRIVFQIMINNRPVFPSQSKIPCPNIRDFYIRVVYVGPRDSNTYRNTQQINAQGGKKSGNLMQIRPDVRKRGAS